MKTILAAIAAFVFAVVSGSGVALADSHEQEQQGETRRFVPVETWTCNYLDGKGAADLDAVIATWNEWMDDNDQDDYFAMTLTPQYFGEDTFDVGWLGSWADGEAMGSGTDFWMTEGRDIAAQFFAVLDCDSHSNFATTELKSPGDGPTPDNIVITFSDCSVPEDPEAWDKLFTNMDAWAAYLGENGYHQGNWMLFPVYGGGGAEFDFKLVEGFDNHTQLGQDYQRFIERADWEKQGELLGGLMDCDDARVYDGRVRRRPAED